MNRGDIVLVEFPFIEGGSERRPALVVQSDALTARLFSPIVAAISSNLRHVGQATQAVIDPAATTMSRINDCLKVALELP